ncbi:MAG: aldo/keto reductase [Nitrospirota bacterium]|nr:aldo/keto reductase [Nitrospirota bacterium]MDP2381394.1 aldo/keto reductase [Nitrospirota bacterium]
MTNPSNSGKTNRLIHETSPYLLQHATNPVDWYPWGPEALQASKTHNRPILLSIGYSACHWCHVMERESFENEAIAALMNRHFICIKVDREERPDLDEIYMQATVTMNRGQGGWPMTVFLTPDQEPFFAGTYFPPDDRWGRPGFPSLLKKIAESWEKDAAALTNQARQLTERLKKELTAVSPVSVSASVLDDAVAQFLEDFDEQHGGFGSAPKFPPSAGLSLLLRCYRRTGENRTLQMVTRTLDAMAAGGIYDHIGGGFARYSTDERWLVPHFEKMLYDNALLAKTYVEAYQVTQQASYRQVTTDVLDYILREMTDPAGGFYSATDADSEGVEGKFFIWTPAEIQAVLQNAEDTRRLCAYYDITDQGNWEHRSIPNRLRPIKAVTKELDLTVDELDETILRVRPLLYRARQERVPPGLDDKIITAWNGMMISAMAEAGRVFGNRRYIDGAMKAADFLLQTHRTSDGTLLRTSRKGRAHLDGVLEDYAYLAEGLIDLYEACGQERYLAAALQLAERIVDSFRDEDQGGFYTTAKTHEPLIIRAREGADGATPSGNAVTVSALARLSYHYDRQDLREAAIAGIRVYGRQMARYPRAFAKSLAVVDLLAEGPVELAFVGAPNDPALEALQRAVREVFLPHRVIASSDGTGKPSTHPLLSGKGLVEGKAALYICRNFSCQRPLTDPQDVTEALRAESRRTDQTAPQTLLQGTAHPGAASPEGTARYAARLVSQSRHAGHMEHGYGRFGSSGFTTSRLGFGTYRVDTREPEQREALKTALREGVNLIDTSTNYMDGDSERLVGSVLDELFKSGELTREEVIVVSKIGYVQGQNLKQAETREQAGRPYPDMVKYGEGIWHCIHPEYLADQLTLSLDRLGLATLDICLLHNPEYFLSEAAHHDGGDLVMAREAFYRRIEQAFTFFESQVAAGRISYYGVSSNTVTADPSNAEATSLSRLYDAARSAAKALGLERHHFGVLQCPMNLYEAGALLTPNTGRDQQETVLALAQQEGIAVLVNRPLNAMPTKKSGVLRLADFPLQGDPVDFERQCQTVAALEEEYRKDIAPNLQQRGQGMPPADFFTWASELTRVRPQIQGLEHWEQIEHQMIAPHFNQVMQALSQQLTGTATAQWEAWRNRYVPQLLTLLGGLRREATERSRTRAASISAALNPLLPQARHNESLSRKSLWVLASTPGVTAVLNGMRSPGYVSDSMEILRWEGLTDVTRLYDTMSKLGQ